MPTPLTCGAPLSATPGAGATVVALTCAHCGNTLALNESAQDAVSHDALLADVRALVQAGQKIEAVKRVREVTRLGLKESKDIVDDVERGLAVTFNTAPPPMNSDAGMTEVHQLIAEGKKIEAIKQYRKLTGVGLKEAKDAVEALQRGQPLPVRAAASGPAAPATRSPLDMLLGCGAILLFIVIILGLIVAASVFMAGF